jgi:transposase
MEKPLSELMAAISPEEWAEVPASVLELIQELVRRMDRFEKEISELRAENELLKEQLAKTSANSSIPPSKNPLNFKPNRKEPTGKKRGGQLGHKGHERKLYPLEMCEEVIPHYPESCSKCGEKVVVEENAQPHRHQIVEVPPIKPLITEHQFYSAICACCGKENQAPEMSRIVSQSVYGSKVAAYVSVLSSQYRQSCRQVQSIMQAVFRIEMSVGAIINLRKEVSMAVSQAVDDAIEYVQKQPSLGSDETGIKQRNGDGQNAAKTSGWLWVVVTPLVICFQIILSRSSEAARKVLGQDFCGFVTSDRCPAYNWVDKERRQVCWAHLKRDFIQMSERKGVGGEIGKELLEQEKRVFDIWYQFRNGEIDRIVLGKEIEPVRNKILSILQEASLIPIEKNEKTPLAKTVRTCCNLLDMEVAMWLFIREEGVEPTNNAAERAIRPAVIWRRTSFGSDSAAGSEFVSRLLTVVSSLNLQERNILEFLSESVVAKRSGQVPPSLIP